MPEYTSIMYTWQLWAGNLLDSMRLPTWQYRPSTRPALLLPSLFRQEQWQVQRHSVRCACVICNIRDKTLLYNIWHSRTGIWKCDPVPCNCAPCSAPSGSHYCMHYKRLLLHLNDTQPTTTFSSVSTPWPLHIRILRLPRAYLHGNQQPLTPPLNLSACSLAAAPATPSQPLLADPLSLTLPCCFYHPPLVTCAS